MMKIAVNSFFAVFLGVVLAACFGAYSGGDTGTITISLSSGSSTGGRAALPWDSSTNIEDLDHTIRLYNGPGSEQSREKVKSNETVQFTVDAGQWDVSVTAYLNGVKKAEGSGKVTIRPGSNGTVPIQMRQLQTTPPGTPEKIYNIGDKGPAGGIVFYDKENRDDGWRYLEAAPADETHSNSVPNDPYLFPWGPSNFDATGGHYDYTGSGKTNTPIIYEKLNGQSPFAAQACMEKNYGGYKDWFLPSYAEMDLMYNNLAVDGLGNFSNSDSYWTSTQANHGMVTRCDFSNGDLLEDALADANFQNIVYRVRAIRAF